MPLDPVTLDQFAEAMMASAFQRLEERFCGDSLATAHHCAECAQVGVAVVDVQRWAASTSAAGWKLERGIDSLGETWFEAHRRGDRQHGRHYRCERAAFAAILRAIRYSG